MSEEGKQELLETLKARLLRQTSYSGFGTLGLCERRFYLDKLGPGDRDSTVDTAFGSAIGAGVQTLWLTGSIEKAKAATFFGWNIGFGDSKDSAKKSIAYALRAVEAFVPFWKALSKDWELALINGKPAIEFSLKIHLPGGFTYRGYVDLVLRHKQTGDFCVIELKTTGFTWEHEAQYKNSTQATSYSLVLDQIAPDYSNFWVKYFTYYSKSQHWVPYDFPKNLMDKVRFIRTLLRDVKLIEQCEMENFWPMRGSACMAFGRVCQYFDACQMQDEHLYAPISVLVDRVQKETERSYSFTISLDEVLDNYISS